MWIYYPDSSPTKFTQDAEARLITVTDISEEKLAQVKDYSL